MSFKTMLTKPMAFILFLFLLLHLPQTLGAYPRIAKEDKRNETGEYKIRPYKGFPGERRGEPCVHPVFSDSLLPTIKNKPSPQLSPQTIPAPILIDKIVAVVNEEIITMIDIDKAIQFYPAFRKAQESEETFYIRVLEDLINYKVVYLEYHKEFTLQEEDYNEIQTAVIEKLGSLDELMAILKSFDMGWLDFKDFIKEKVIYERVLDEKLQVKITIDFKEIENFYHKEYRPLQEELELQPLSLFEMAPQIENHLRKVQTQEKLADWLKEIRSSYKIENKLLKEQE